MPARQTNTRLKAGLGALQQSLATIRILIRHLSAPCAMRGTTQTLQLAISARFALKDTTAQQMALGSTLLRIGVVRHTTAPKAQATIRRAQTGTTALTTACALMASTCTQTRSLATTVQLGRLAKADPGPPSPTWTLATTHLWESAFSSFVPPGTHATQTLRSSARGVSIRSKAP